MPKYVDGPTLRKACAELPGTSGTFMFCWFALKAKGLTEENPVVIDTTNTTEGLKRLWSWGEPTGKLLFPLSAKSRFRTYAPDSSRSVVQTNVKQWCVGSGATTNPGKWLDIRQNEDKTYTVSLRHGYGDHLGQGVEGFASADGLSVSIPLLAFAIWYGRQTAIPDGTEPEGFLIKDMLEKLHISRVERECVFRDKPLSGPSYRDTPLTDGEIYELLKEDSAVNHDTIEEPETPAQHIERIGTMQTVSGEYAWLDYDPEAKFQDAVDSGERAIVLVGAPRTGKSRAVRRYAESKGLNEKDVTIIQLHDGWTYNHLMLGQTITKDGSVDWEKGPLLKAIEEKRPFIVLEEANRTRLSEALGELFQALEPAYRDKPLRLANGEDLVVSPDTTFIFTMNDVDKSTEDIDDALLGRCAVIGFRPRVEALIDMLEDKGIDAGLSSDIRRFFKRVTEEYPLGQGYFAALPDHADVKAVTDYYVTRIRPVLESHFSSEPAVLSGLDKSFDEIVVKPSAGGVDA